MSTLIRWASRTSLRPGVWKLRTHKGKIPAGSQATYDRLHHSVSDTAFRRNERGDYPSKVPPAYLHGPSPHKAHVMKLL
jgi:hypothetical protein